MNYRIRMAETMRRKIARQVAKQLLISRVEWRGVCHQHTLMILGSPCQQCSDKRNPKTSALISEKISKAGRFIVLMLRQVGIGKLAYRHKQRSDSQPLQRSRPRFMAIVRG